MRVPLSWLGEVVRLPSDATAETVHADLVRVGFEEESIRRFEVSGPVVVGRVLSRDPEEHANGKTVNWCRVRVAPDGEQAADGGDPVRGIVCGAHNFAVGDRVVVALPGAVLPGGFEISARRTYGHLSDGMLASARELSLGEDHDGILVLDRLGVTGEVGEDALALLGMRDTAVEINVTPERGYALSIRGIGRELAHATGAEYRDPALAILPAPVSGFPLSIEDDAPIRGRRGATAFVARVVRGIEAGRPTPPWMAARLQLAGVRPLSLPVDISNFVMLELGIPLHAYDLQALDGGITVRRARAGERLETLDGQDRALGSEDLVIADAAGAIGLAGVMGGARTKTGPGTVDVLVEAAVFDPVSIARSARRHRLPSEASRRFERGVDPLLAARAAERAVQLLVELAGGTAAPLGAEISAPWNPEPVRLPLGLVAGLTGAEISREEIRDALVTIGCEIAVETVGESADGERGPGEAGAILVIAPSWRSDLTRPVDLVEEVARIVGYDRIPSALPVAPAGRGFTREQRLRRRAATAIAAAGFDEVQSAPFVGRAPLDAFGSGPRAAGEPGVPAVRLANALDAEAPFLRRSLLPGLVAAARRNVSRGLLDLALVEFGAVFEPVPDDAPPAQTPAPGVRPSAELLARLDASLPVETRRVGGLLLGDAVPRQLGAPSRAVDWADAVDAARLLAESLPVSLVVRAGHHPAFHPGRTAELCVEDASGQLRVVGVAGELLPEIAAAAHLPGRVSAFELELSELIALALREPRIRPLSGFPAATQDLTVVVPDSVPAGEVAEAIAAGAGELLEDARLVDDYRGDGIAEHSRALTVALRFRAPDRTLTAEEASEAKLAGLAVAAERFGATLRD